MVVYIPMVGVGLGAIAMKDKEDRMNFEALKNGPVEQCAAVGR